MTSYITLKKSDSFLIPADPRNPAQVLQACLDNINRGNWIKGSLVRELLAEGDHPRACAVGLLAIYGGNATMSDDTHLEVGYPNSQWTDSSIKAARCLYKVIKPVSWETVEDVATAELSDKIVAHNDDTMSYASATIISWFQKAIKLAEEHYG